ncbi:peroxiredoxin family protein [Bacillus marinisedimentorum]|uniref:peroxiredoxin family protein n=1 Tax=Bacillus marinisedimentorum TaxID=1821260 RepID=UPI0009F39C38|nr:TlpA disulfide reductase family protein [Bacillus marinisedimentorum]
MNWKGVISILIIAGLGAFAVWQFIDSNSGQEAVELPESNSGKMDDSGSTDSGNGETPSKEADGDVVGVAVGNKAPDFELQTLEGESVKLSDYRGQKVLVNLWASWCPPCRAEMPDIQDLYEKYKDDGFVVLGVNLTSAERENNTVQPFVEEFGLTFPILMDIRNEVGRTYQAISIPTSYFIDSEGIIHQKIIGQMSRETIENNIKEMD